VGKRVQRRRVGSGARVAAWPPPTCMHVGACAPARLAGPSSRQTAYAALPGCLARLLDDGIGQL
jgi:hypothetical protein